MGQMLSREDDDERQYDDSHQDHQHVEDSAAEVKEKPKRRQRNATAIRSRRPRTATQGRTRRNRTTNPMTFEVREH
jgi:hypothetical protein